MGQQIPGDSNSYNKFPVLYETGTHITSVTRTHNFRLLEGNLIPQTLSLKIRCSIILSHHGVLK
jgi:hypothetical protein